MGFFSDVAGGLVSSIPLVGPSISSAMGLSTTPSFNLDVGSIAGDYLKDKFIGQPQANSAYAMSKEAADVQYQRTKDLYSKRYQLTMADMKKAGLNPLLAAKGITGSMPSISSASSYMAPPVSGTTASSAKNWASAGLDTQKIAESAEQVLKIREEKGLITTQERVAWQTIDKVAAEVTKAQEEIRLIRKKAEKTELESQRERVLIKQTQFNAEKLSAELAKLRKIAKMYNVPYLGAGVAAIKEILGTLPVGILVGGKKGTTTNAFTEYGKGWKNTTTERR